eukprot:CAMPEP_0201507860 /NCGR_PEP_ID=MMETSP0161_2-20130828/1390_1 /ASSEMBLY_ACC=CAM_ASM_000251 /TAXON_ID=180227 /ORGANISM="Neoparamoeba aestuarina, Strain SoJaBio B1-5/56/2" /LENGTH=291 /DNA_ID=CAMNT_0047902337 /DNA_START=77 /DNA_END=948 /DNA_ORIENTATION=-
MDISKFDDETKAFLRGMNQECIQGDNDDIRHEEEEKDDRDLEEEQRVYDEVMATEERAAHYARMGGGPSSQQYVNTVRPKHNTGVKGVLADYNEWRERVIAENKEAAAAQMAELNKKALRSKYEKYEPEEEEEEDWEGSDDEFFSAWKHKQTQQMIANVPVFGRVREIGVGEYVSAIDNEKESVYVVIHLYENDVEACKFVNFFLDQLAPPHKHVKFLKIVASDAQQNWQRKALPTLLVYKEGDLIQKHIDLANIITLDTALSLEQFFFDKGIIAAKKYVPVEKQAKEHMA